MKYESKPEPGGILSCQRGSSQKLLLGLLAGLVALFGYLYFFTGVIRQPAELQSLSPRPVQVKQPIPARIAAENAQPPAAQKEAVKPEAVAPSAMPVAAVQPQAPPAKPAVQPVKPPAEQQKPAAPVPSPAAAQKPAKPVAAAEKVPATKTSPPAPAPRQAVSTPSPKPSQAREPQAKPAADTRIRLETGEILSLQKADKAVAQLKEAGLAGVERLTARRELQMNRLFIAEFADKDAARAELEKLRPLAGGAFIMPAGSKYELYAGSYEQEQRAAVEKQRLYGKVSSVTIRKQALKLPVYRVSARAAGKAEADKGLARLRKLGISASAQPLGK